MTLELPELGRAEWVASAAPERRLRLRRDGTGYYEREASGDSPFVHENLLFRVEGDELVLKLAHARGWTRVRARLEGDALCLARDPYAFVLEERDTGELVLVRARVAALP